MLLSHRKVTVVWRRTGHASADFVVQTTCVLKGLSVKLQLRDERTNGRMDGKTDIRWVQNLVLFSCTGVTSVGNNFSDLPDNQLTKFRVFIGLSRTFYRPRYIYMKHRGSFPHGIDAPDRHNGQRDKRTNERTDEETRQFTLRRGHSIHAYGPLCSATFTSKPESLCLQLNDHCAIWN